MHLFKTTVCVLMVLLLACACGGGTDRQPQGTPALSAAVLVPSTVGGEDATWRVDITGGTPPYRVVWDFGTGATPGVVTQEDVGASSELSVTMLNPLLSDVDSTLSVDVYDATGLRTTAQNGYTIARGANPTRPVIRDTSYNPETGILSVVVSHWRSGEGIQVTAESITGVTVVNPVETMIIAGEGTLHFLLQPPDLFNPSQGELLITAEDSLGYTDTWQQSLELEPRYQLAPDTLYAIPLRTEARVGQKVTVLIAAGELPHPFAGGPTIYISSPTGISWGSVNLGDLGGYWDDLDGMWAGIGPLAGIMYPDSLIFPFEPINGLEVMQHSRYPLGTVDVIGASGTVFSLEVSFSKPGEYQLGFWPGEYDHQWPNYMSASWDFHPWGDISNDHPGIPNTVTVE